MDVWLYAAVTNEDCLIGGIVTDSNQNTRQQIIACIIEKIGNVQTIEANALQDSALIALAKLAKEKGLLDESYYN